MASKKIDCVDWGVVSRPLPGETECGDLHFVAVLEKNVLVAVVDGLGHGKHAAEASRTAIGALAEHPEEPLLAQINRCHEKLNKTRGAAMTIAFIDIPQKTLSWAGVGNVEGLLVRASEGKKRFHEYAPLKGGIVGIQLPNIRPMIVPLVSGDRLIFATDGIKSAFSESIDLSLSPEQSAADLLEKYARPSDDALVLVLHWKGSGER